MTTSARTPRTRKPGPGTESRVALADIAHGPVPAWARGALVTHAPGDMEAPIPVTWFPQGAVVPDGSVLLSWQPATTSATEVSARLGLTSGEVTLAHWPNLCGDWPRVIQPTLHEVLGLHAALSLAKDALRLANHLLDSH